MMMTYVVWAYIFGLFICPALLKHVRDRRGTRPDHGYSPIHRFYIIALVGPPLGGFLIMLLTTA
ncbi:hypothetical protein, partial [Methylobrevis pamukkalensis]|uniref:hypothetical protein n=1 Tax=Methylobrevis pamukkalensis TaxID=1439726 RepID=UPI001AEC7ED7